MKICLLHFAFVSAFGILNLILFFSLFFHWKRDGRDIGTKDFRYQYFERDFLSNSSSFGVVSLYEKIEESNVLSFLSYSDTKFRKQVLISSFGTEEFECFGSCYCEGDNYVPRRRVSQSRVFLLKSVSYLLAAVSSVVAIRLSEEYFSHECTERYSGLCSAQKSVIVSEVESCHSLQDEEEDGTSIIGEVEKYERRVYFCYGNCVENRRVVKHRPTKFRNIECKKLKREGEVVVLSNSLLVKSKKHVLSSRMRETARNRFQQQFLRDFCKKESKVVYEYKYPVFRTLKSGQKRRYIDRRIQVGYICTGVTSTTCTRHSHTRNVNCRQIVPAPKSRNSEYIEGIWWEKKKEWDNIYEEEN